MKDERAKVKGIHGIVPGEWYVIIDPYNNQELLIRVDDDEPELSHLLTYHEHITGFKYSRYIIGRILYLDGGRLIREPNEHQMNIIRNATLSNSYGI